MDDLKELSDSDLMFEYQNANMAAFDVLYERHHLKVYSYLRRRIKNIEEAEEIFQRVFGKLHNSRHTYSSQYAFTQWLYVIVKTVLLDHWESEKRRNYKLNLYEQNIKNFDPYITTNEDHSVSTLDLVKATLDKLSSEQRQALELRVFDELAYDEIAKRLNASEVGVRKMVSRAIKKLKDHLTTQSGGGQ